MTLQERLESRTKKDPSGCWLWQGGRTGKGYGAIGVEGKTKGVHRVAWELVNGPIPDGMLICHHCDIRNCINPEHLFLGTHTDNMQDALKKGRLVATAPWRGVTHCKNGHLFNEKNTYSYTWKGSENRTCKLCNRLWQRKRYHNNNGKEKAKERRHRRTRKVNG